MSLLKRIIFRFPTKGREARIVLLGPSGAGKTTLVRYLETGLPVEENPRTTMGIDIRKTPILINGWSFKAVDLGGQELYQRTFWALAIEQAGAVVFVIDGTIRPKAKDSDQFERSVFQFEYALSLVSDEIPFLILVNKQDLSHLSPLSTREALTLYGIAKIQRNTLGVLPTSAKFGTGVQDAVEWLIHRVSEKRTNS